MNSDLQWWTDNSIGPIYESWIRACQEAGTIDPTPSPGRLVPQPLGWVIPLRSDRPASPMPTPWPETAEVLTMIKDEVMRGPPEDWRGDQTEAGQIPPEPAYARPPLVTGMVPDNSDPLDASSDFAAACRRFHIDAANSLGRFIERRLEEAQKAGADPRAIAIARTQFQTGVLWLTAAIVQPAAQG